MKQLRHFIILPFLILLFGCSEEDSNLSTNYPNGLVNSWVESYEESPGVYRPSGFMTFPSSRFRQVYTFNKDGSCEFLVLSSVDAHYIQYGKWQYDDENKMIRIYDADNHLLRDLEVKSINATKLVLVM
ncbi:hypothetical protein [Reichenbachiella ulvae]|uniref:Lipocalin-like domain-containing protein n=1 Tax=Reichenbachiella ulvae TaxID=2980104 RepID=A0ABT3CP58_9BACT|nr:hypothetical protein [Reichenbachiella ulvae]MCV9385309.1 hypothetical protein [Reichenbachiella ulvae]